MAARSVAAVRPRRVAEENDDAIADVARLGRGVVDADRRPEVLGGATRRLGGIRQSLMPLAMLQLARVAERARDRVAIHGVRRLATDFLVRRVRSGVDDVSADAVRVRATRLCTRFGYTNKKKSNLARKNNINRDRIRPACRPDSLTNDGVVSPNSLLPSTSNDLTMKESLARIGGSTV